MQDLTPFAEPARLGRGRRSGAAFAALGARLVPGARWLLERIDFRAYLRDADLAVSGEGKLDATTLEGKAPWEARRMARRKASAARFSAGASSSTSPTCTR